MYEESIDDRQEISPQISVIEADISSSFTYASFQNAIPVLRSIQINNTQDRILENCRLELTSSPAFLRPKSWTIDRLIPGDKLSITDRKVDLDADYLAGLNEAERGEVTLRLMEGDTVLAVEHHPVRLLARDEWGGVSDMDQLLPAFVMPNDPAVAQILRNASERLIAGGHANGLDGYQSKDPARSYILAAAIYSAIASLDLHYVEPPASFEERGQKIRRPGTISADKLGTCLDLTLLFASAFEAAGLYPVILLFDGHAAVGVWLQKKGFNNTIEHDQIEVRKALASRELIIFETTGITGRPAMSLEAAQSNLDPRMEEDQAAAFVAAIDVHRARSGGITPLASHEAKQALGDDEGTEQSGSDLALPSAPDFAALPVLEIEQKPSTAAGRIDRWQKKLLDLTLRNRLLNFPPSKKTIPFLCTDVAYLEDRLSEGAAIQIVSLPQQNPLGERDAGLYREVHGRDLQRGYAAEALQRDELPSPLEQQDLQARLIDLHRQVKNDFAEGGANTLFLAVGFLRWKKKPEDERSYRAPLLLIPIKLERRSASSAFRIKFHEDEPRFNATLLQFLERDFDLKLPQFNAELPTDESGVDVVRVLAMMQQAVRDVPGMEVIHETALSTFSFAKFLMWKDLVERTDALRENRIVKHLIDNPEQAFTPSDGPATFIDEHQLDKVYAPSQIISLLPADSSQTAASIAAAEGQDFVIVGPPGTGKSQTIANIIANCLAAGKTVLFVAEKTAALDVVYRRLREHGLGEHCIELHSNKADRRHFLKQLKASWEQGSNKDQAEWIAINERLRVRRDSLNAYVDALHKEYPNGWTPYKALGIALRASDKPAPEIDWAQDRALDAETFRGLEDVAQELGLTYKSVPRKPALELVDIEDLSAAKQEAILSAASDLRASAEDLVGTLDQFRSAWGISQSKLQADEEIDALAAFANAVGNGLEYDLTISFAPDFSNIPGELTELDNANAGYRNAEERVSATYLPASVRDLDVEGIDRQWREAKASLWPMSALGRWKLTRLLQSYADEGQVQPEQDLPHLRTMKEQLGISDASALKTRALPFAGLDTNISLICEIIERSRTLRQALKLNGRSPEEIISLTERTRSALQDRDENERLWGVGIKLIAVAEAFEKANANFAALAGRAPMINDGPDALDKLVHSLTELADARHMLRDWTTWCRIRNKAIACGLASLVAQLEGEAIQPDETKDAFLLGYARWWLPRTLDEDAVLREFRRFSHENSIIEFREIDDLVRVEATNRVISSIAHGLPSVQSVPRNSELGLLRHQMELQRPSQSIRDMIGKMPNSFSKLAPCMLMSPLSIAQYFPTNQALFDVVIFDEASQITTWDAVGAIARGRQTIIVGDPKQLPPTNFFGRNEEEEEVQDHERDLESILDEAKASGIPVRDLRWHYRSRSESLIAFSNHHYYQNRLVTFPAPHVDDRAVQLRKVPNGVYDRGKSRTNRIEAQAVADEAVARMRAWLELPEKTRPTLGVITFNAQQQSLILDLLDLARRDEPELEWFFADERVEGTIVKNLENVQGDERDVILFSITFWKDAADKLTMDFGALNRDGGERRLNVAVTRARQELVVFSGFTADQIDPTRTKAIGVHHLKTFLDYAERGAIALPAETMGSVGGFDSPFEEAVADQLQSRGWQVVPQVGISGFRIDLGIRHPDLPGAFLAGVECDGATYHSAATARDRDKVREQVLTGLGWNILRVWSTDWWYDAKGCADRLHAALEALLASNSVSADNEPIVAHWDMGHEVEGIEEIRDDEASIDVSEPTPPPAVDAIQLVSAQAENVIDGPTARSEDGCYSLTDLSAFEALPDSFYEFPYRETIQAMVEAVMETESPLRTDILCQRIARAHGWLRTGAKIRERIDIHLRDYDRTEESSGEFIWKRGEVAEVRAYRPPANDEARRSIPDIPLAELTSVVRDNPGLLEEPDPARELARLLGVERLAAGSRARLVEAITQARGQ